MLHYISCNTMHPHYGAIPVPNVPVRFICTRCFGRTSIYLCASSLQDLAGPQDFYYPLDISVERFPHFHSISSLFTQLMIAFVLLKAFNTNTLTFHQCFKDKLSSHQPSHMHNTRHRTNSNFNTPLFNHSKTQKCYLYQVIPIWSSLPS